MITAHINLEIPNTWRYAIVRHGGAGYGEPWTPSLQPCQDGRPANDGLPQGTGKGADVPVTESCWRFIEKIHAGNPGGYQYVRGIGLMWINIGYDNTIPYSKAKAGQIVGGGNFVLFDKLTATHGHVVCFDWDFDFGALDPTVTNWKTCPHLFTKCTAYQIASGGSVVGNVGNGADAYFPNMRGRDNGLQITPTKWLHLGSAELFPGLPFNLTDGNVVTSYRLHGASVLGLIGTEWKYLLKSTKPGERIFPTSWKLDTVGAVPPVL